MSNRKWVNPNKRPRSDSGTENDAEDNTNQTQNANESPTPSIKTENTPREEEADNIAIFHNNQAKILAEIKAKVTQKCANNLNTQDLPTYGDQEYTPSPQWLPNYPWQRPSLDSK